MAKLSEVQKRKEVVKTIRSIWESLDSHLDWCVEKNPKEKDPRMFHVKTSQQYGEDILRLIKTLK